MSQEFVVYVLTSRSHPEKRYTGMTGDLVNRIRSHNIFASKGYTIRYRPWNVCYVRFFNSRREAAEHEKYLKSGVGREYLNRELE